MRAAGKASAKTGAGVPGRSARALRVLGGARGARRGHDARSHVRDRLLHVRGERARHHGVRAPAVVAPFVQGGVASARAAPVDEQRSELGLGDPLEARHMHVPPVLAPDGGPVRSVARRLLARRRAVAAQARAHAASEPTVHERGRPLC